MGSKEVGTLGSGLALCFVCLSASVSIQSDGIRGISPLGHVGDWVLLIAANCWFFWVLRAFYIFIHWVATETLWGVYNYLIYKLYESLRNVQQVTQQSSGRDGYDPGQTDSRSFGINALELLKLSYCTTVYKCTRVHTANQNFTEQYSPILTLECKMHFGLFFHFFNKNANLSH